MTYVDCYLTPVPRANRTQYEQLALISAEVVRGTVRCASWSAGLTRLGRA